MSRLSGQELRASDQSGVRGARQGGDGEQGALEKDACGVGFIVHIDGRTTHSVVESAQELSRRMTHRGACSADNDSGDGAGALLGIPHSFYQARIK